MEHHEIDAKLVERMKKLLALATNNDNEHQATAAMEKLTAMLEEHNLDMAVLGKSDATRKDAKRKGGLYGWQRKLWDSVAKLNFCVYFSIRGLDKGSSYEHRLVGSHANVIATEMMATYLQDTIERLAAQWAKDVGHHSRFVREAIAYREGMTERVSNRLYERREALLSAARKEAEERKRDQAMANRPSTGTELTILDVVSSEADFNNDYLQGWEMGTTARNRAEQEARVAAWRASEAKRQAEQAAWDLLHPAEAAARKKAEQDRADAFYNKLARRKPSKEPVYRTRRATPEEERRSLGSYYEGYDRGGTVGIDTQVDQNKTRRIG